MRVLVTGGTGTLGKAVVAQLAATDYATRLMSRKTITGSGTEMVPGDMATGAGLAEALQDVDVVINCASSPGPNAYEVDVAGTKRLAEIAREQGIEHIIHVSIIGIDRIPHPYYQVKLAAELAVIEAGVPYSIIRIAQFHDFLDARLQPLRTVTESSLRLTLDTQFHLIDVRDAARYLVNQAGVTPGAYRADVGGPQINTLDHLARAWLDVQGNHRPLVDAPPAEAHVSFPEGYRQGYNTTRENAYGSITWPDYLQAKYGKTPGQGTD